MAHIFVGRKQELQQFDQVLNPRQKVAKAILGPRTKIKPHVFLPYGMGGMGKSFLSRECLLRAKDAGWKTVEIDWDRADTRPGDKSSMMSMIAEKIKGAYQESTIKNYLKVLHDSKKIQERVNHYRQENQEKWPSITESAKSLAETAGGEKGKSTSVVIDLAGKTINIGAASLAQAEDAFIEWMISKGI